VAINRAGEIVIAESLIRDGFLDGYSQGFRDGKTMGFEMRKRINKRYEII
jgi:hypothetical protein